MEESSNNSFIPITTTDAVSAHAPQDPQRRRATTRGHQPMFPHLVVKPTQGRPIGRVVDPAVRPVVQMMVFQIPS
jgi:hypothetical protein